MMEHKKQSIKNRLIFSLNRGIVDATKNVATPTQIMMHLFCQWITAAIRRSQFAHSQMWVPFCFAPAFSRNFFMPYDMAARKFNPYHKGEIFW